MYVLQTKQLVLLDIMFIKRQDVLKSISYPISYGVTIEIVVEDSLSRLVVKLWMMSALISK